MQSEKKYPIILSPLYRLSSIDVLAKTLGFSVDKLLKLDDYMRKRQGSGYRRFKTGPKQREVQQPVFPPLRIAQRRVFILLSRIATPDYLHSGVKHRSYITNAAQHTDNPYCLTMDISHFYASTRAEAVFQFYKYKLEIVDDLSRILTNICTFDSTMIPTGSSISQLIAYWAYSDMFDQIAEKASSIGATFSLYVDDMTFSNNEPFPNDFHADILYYLKTRWLKFKPTKLLKYYPNQAREITGCRIESNGHITAPKKLKVKAYTLYRRIKKDAYSCKKDIQRAIGLMGSAQSIDPSLFRTEYEELRGIIKRKVS